jgi:choline dehydrogenase
MSLSRARVIGGCSAHNAAFVVWGDRRDYEEWAAPGWGFDAIEPYLRGAERTIRTRQLGAAELGPWARAVRDAAPEAGIPVLDDLNDLPSTEGAAHMPVNANGFARWNTAFAYLDDARARENLTVIGDALVDRVLLDGLRAQGAIVLVAKRDRRRRSSRRAGDPDRPGRARRRGEPAGPLRHQRRLSGGPGA